MSDRLICGLVHLAKITIVSMCDYLRYVDAHASKTTRPLLRGFDLMSCFVAIHPKLFAEETRHQQRNVLSTTKEITIRFGIERPSTVVGRIARSKRDEKVEAMWNVPIEIFVRSHKERRV